MQEWNKPAIACPIWKMYLLTYYILGILLNSAEKYWKLIHGVLAVGVNQNHIEVQKFDIL